jgi:hypothetical protein
VHFVAAAKEFHEQRMGIKPAVVHNETA